MSWLKEVILDIAVTIFIIAAVFVDDSWMLWTIWVYTGLMLLTKGLVLLGDGVQQVMRKVKTRAPEWFSHLLYAINTGMLLYAGWWFAAAGWALIWLFSFLTQRRLQLRAEG